MPLETAFTRWRRGGSDDAAAGHGSSARGAAPGSRKRCRRTPIPSPRTTLPPGPRAPRGRAARALMRVAALAGTALCAAPAMAPGAASAWAAAPPSAADAPIALVPGIAFAWTDPGTEALLAFQLRPPRSHLDQVTGVRLPGSRVVVAGYSLEPASGTLRIRVRAERAGDVAVRRLQLQLRYAPAQTVPVRTAEVLALHSGDGPLALRRWASDDAAGLYAAFALVNRSAAAVTVHALRYAPQRLGRGLVLAQTGPPAGFEEWRDRVLERTQRAFAGYLRARGHDPRAPARTPAPASLAFPLAGPLADARWRASDALDETVAPGQALYLAVTPAAFSAYVDDLAIAAYPVLAYRTPAGCCRLQGVSAPILHVVDANSPGMGGASR